jgi:hypothetical protein
MVWAAGKDNCTCPSGNLAHPSHTIEEKLPEGSPRSDPRTPLLSQVTFIIILQGNTALV